MSNFTVHLYQTSPGNAEAGGGSLSLSESGGSYTAEAKLTINKKPVNANLTGKAVGNDGNLTIVDLRSGDGSLKMTLIRNPYESRLSYGGCAAYGSLIYNVTAVAAS